MTLAVYMTHDLDWQLRAACRGMNRDIFFPDDYDVPSPRARRVCRRCSVTGDCLQWALKHDEVGIWGGLTDDERRKISITRSRVRCPDCRSQSVKDDGHFEVCLSCGLSWPI